MAQSIETEPLSVKRLLGFALLSIALILSISTFTDKRITLDTSRNSLKLKSISPPVYADAVPDILTPDQPAQETPQEAPQEEKPAEVVQTPPPVVEAPVEPPKPVEKPKPAPKPVIVDQVGAKAFIYEKESGNNPLAVNKRSGACGLGQRLPCSALQAECPDMTDYECQDRHFTRYMQSRYGSWENARAFWLANKWW